MTIACPDCGTLEEIPRLLRRDTAVCIRCQGDLEKVSGRSIGAALACSLATLLLLVPLNVLAMVDVYLRRSRRRLVLKTKVLRVIAEMGRWSKTDPFAIVFFVPLIHFGSLGSEDAGWGATAFMMMTFLTMVASVTFDPRLMWDAGGGTA